MYIGRILSRLSKDQDTLDNELSMTLMQVRTTYYLNQPKIIINIFLIVSVDFQLSPGNGRAGFLYFPFARNHICPDGRNLLFGVYVLPPNLC